MAQQTVGFNPLEVSYKGAGKVYEALASNAKQSSQVAATEQAQHTAAGRQAQALSQSYLDRANNTRNRASAAANKATSYADKAQKENYQYQQSVREMERASIISISNSFRKIGDYVSAAKIDADTTKGVIDGQKFSKEVTQVADTDPAKALQMVEDFNNQLTADPKDAYLKGMARYMIPTYGQVLDKAEEGRVQTVMSNLLINYESTNQTMSPKDLKDFADTNNVPVAMARDVTYLYSANKYAELLTQATTKQEVKQVLDLWEKKKKEDFAPSNMFKIKKSATQGMVTKGDKALSDALIVANKNIDRSLELQIVEGTNSWEDDTKVGIDFKDVAGAVSERYAGKPVETNNKLKKLKKDYITHTKQVEFNSNVDVAKPKPSKYITTENWVDDKYLSKKVVARGSVAFEEGNTETFMGVANNNSTKVTGDLGGYIVQRYHSAETQEELTDVFNKTNVILEQPGGAAALRRTMKDEDYIEMATVNTISKSLYGGDISKAKNMFETAQQNVSANVLTRDLKNTMGRRQTQLGDNYNKYASTMNMLNNISPRVAKQMESTVSEYYDNMHIEVDTSDGETLKVNTADGPLLTEASAAPEESNRVIREVVLKEVGEEGSISTSGDGNIIIKDAFGAVQSVFNTKPIIVVEDKAALIRQQAEVAQNGLPAGEVALSTAVAIGKGFVKAPIQLASRLGDSIYENDKEFYDYIGDLWDKFGDVVAKGKLYAAETFKPSEARIAEAAEQKKFEVEQATRTEYKTVRTKQGVIALRPKTDEDRAIEGLSILQGVLTTTMLPNEHNPMATEDALVINYANHKNKVNVAKIDKLKEELVKQKNYNTGQQLIQKLHNRNTVEALRMKGNNNGTK